MTTAQTPSWPSLYNPGLEILSIEHREAKQPGGSYLERPIDVFRFTLYWTLIFYMPIFLLCGFYAWWNLTFPPSRSPSRPSYALHHTQSSHSSSFPLSPLPLTSRTEQAGLLLRPTALPKAKERRSRIAFALLVLLTFLSVSVAGAVVGSAVLGFTASGLYKAAKYHMSTWIPFLLAVMQVLVGLLSVWPSIIDII